MSSIRVISLERSAARREKFARMNAHLDFRFFDAVDGAALAADDPRRAALFRPGLPYSPGAYGCALSHLALWEEAIAGGSPVTVAEDDAIFRLDFVARRDAALAALPPDWDIVIWGWNLDYVLSLDFMPGVSPAVVRFDQDQMRNGIDVFRAMTRAPQLLPLDMVWGIPAYTISPAGARRFRKRCFPLECFSHAVPVTGAVLTNTGIDSAMNRIYATTHSYVSFPPLAITENDHSISTIQQVKQKSLLSKKFRALRERVRRAFGRRAA